MVNTAVDYKKKELHVCNFSETLSY